MLLENPVESQRHVREDENEAGGLVIKCFDEADDVLVGQGRQEPSFEAGVVRGDVGFDNDFKGVGIGAIDLGGGAVIDVVTVGIATYFDAGTCRSSDTFWW